MTNSEFFSSKGLRSSNYWEIKKEMINWNRVIEKNDLNIIINEKLIRI